MTLGLEFSWFFSQKYFHHNFAHLLLKPLDWSKVIGASTGDLESPNSRYTLRKIRKKALQRPWETLIFLHEDLTTFEKESITKIMTHIREAPFWNVLVLHGHCPNSLRPPPPPPLCQMGKCGKKCPKPSWQALSPPGNVRKKCPKPSWPAFTHPHPPYGQCPYGNNTFSKRSSPSSACLMFEIVLICRYQCGSRLLANASQQVGLIGLLSELPLQILMLRIFLRKMFQQAGLLNQLRAILGVLRDEGSGICR